MTEIAESQRAALLAAADTLITPTTARAFARQRGLSLTRARNLLGILEAADLIERAEDAPGKAYIRKPTPFSLNLGGKQ